MQDLHFTAIDFETANNSRNSICQIGICRVENGEATYLDSFLVQPPNNEYSHWNVCIHGIIPDQTSSMPSFPVVWSKVKCYIEDQVIIAHNASFDCDCLCKTLEHYQIPKPNYRVECTYAYTGLSLEDLAEALDIQIVSHHNAMYDALACAEAYIKLKKGHTPDLSKITKKEKKSPFEGHGRISGDLLKPCLESADMNSPFYGKKVVFTGIMDGISREDAAKLVKQMGADIDGGVTKKTDFVIVGSGAGPSKLKKIKEYNYSGSNIKIIYECEFLKLIAENKVI
jgi:DNA polymerase-3 subunit epsilon